MARPTLASLMNPPVEPKSAAAGSSITYPGVSEVLVCLVKIYQAKWRQYYLDRPLIASRSREKHALITGVLRVEAQLALAAMEKNQWQQVSEDLKTQLTTLGITSLENTRWRRLTELIDGGAWSVAVREFDTWALEIEEVFIERRDQKLALFFRLASWLRLLHLEAVLASRPVITDPPSFLPSVDLWTYLGDLTQPLWIDEKPDKPAILDETRQLLAKMKEWARGCTADFRSVTEPSEWLAQYFKQLFT